MPAADTIPDDDEPDAIVQASAMVAVAIMLVGLVAFPLAGAWRRGEGGGSGTARCHRQGAAVGSACIDAAPAFSRRP